MASLDRKKLEEIVNSLPSAQGVFLIDVQDGHEKGGRILRVFVDTDEGITIAACAALSRELGPALDTLQGFVEPYQLEVSSPGIDKPLRLLRQYRKNIGRKFTVRYRTDQEVRTLAGTLTAVEGEQLTFACGQDERKVLDFSCILESSEELPW